MSVLRFHKLVPISGILLAGLMVGVYAPTIGWMLDRWLAAGSCFSHGFLIPPVALAWAWLRLRAGAPKADRPSNLGLGIASAGLGLQAASMALQIHFTSAISAVVVLAGTINYVWGPRTFRLVLSPLVFLLFMIPIPLVTVARLALEMKLFAASAGLAIAGWAGAEGSQQGSFILVGSERLLVGDACSGLRSMIALLALGFVAVHRVRGGLVFRCVVYATVVPFALLGNAVRVAILCGVAGRFGVQAIQGPVHFGTGVLTYLVTLAGVLALAHVAGRLRGATEEGT